MTSIFAVMKTTRFWKVLLKFCKWP